MGPPRLEEKAGTDPQTALEIRLCGVSGESWEAEILPKVVVDGRGESQGLSLGRGPPSGLITDGSGGREVGIGGEGASWWETLVKVAL